MTQAPKIRNGYFLISRLLFEKQLWQATPEEIKLAIYILGTARHKPEPKKFTGFEVKRGELITSLSQIAENCQWYENRKVRTWSRQKVSRMLSVLENIGFIEQKSDTYGTHIKVCNYEFYQTANNYKSDTVGTTLETYNNDKNVKKDKKTPSLSPPSKEVLKNKIIENGLEQYKDKILEFYDYRMSMKAKDRYKTEKGLDGLISDVKGCIEQNKIIEKCIDITMRKEWKTPDPTYFKDKDVKPKQSGFKKAF